jgi:polysaccharide pyruvyl transferase WcaK-like protein
MTAIPFTPAPRHPAPSILLRSSWQTVNIGDIGHTPGILRLLEQYLPDAKVTLWPGNIDGSVRQMLARHFPHVEMVDGDTDADGQPIQAELRAAFARHDFLLHGSGPSVVALKHLDAWRRITGKPYGIFGVTIDPVTAPEGRASEGGTLAQLRQQMERLPADHLDPLLRSVLTGAAFILCRDSLSLGYLQSQRIPSQLLGFVTDAAFGIAIRNDALASEFLRTHRLETRKFICLIPRTRYTPYHLVHGTAPTAEDLRRAMISGQHLEADLAKMAEVVERWVTKTAHRVLVCPEMTYQVDIGRILVERLPARVRSNVVWRPNYWMPDEAIATYACAHTVVSMDNHSPIFALTQGTPAFYIRQPTDTTKGQMWPDLGMEDWFFEIEETTGTEIARRLLAIESDWGAAARRVRAIMDRVRTLQHDSMARLMAALSTVSTI